jgi:hypothetical protein
MANYFSLTLDTLAPVSPAIKLNDNATYAAAQLVTAIISTSDSSTSGYTMKLWGDLDLTQAMTDGIVGSSATEVTEDTAQWLTFAASKQLKLSTGDGAKTVYLKIRDDVYNISAQVSASITLDTTAPIVTISGPDVTKISKQSGKNVCTFSFSGDSDIQAYKVKVVASAGAAHTTGTDIGTANGSTNMSGGTTSKGTTITCTVNGADLEAASAGDGEKIIKVFAQDLAGNWSI